MTVDLLLPKADDFEARRYAITGASGLIGQALSSRLRSFGAYVHAVTRSPKASGDIGWDPSRGELSKEPFEGLDGVVHLAGESVGARWTKERRKRIRASRLDGTTLLATRLASLDECPPVLLSASAVGFYGSRDDEELTERAPGGDGFLAEVCRVWEEAAEPARDAGIRVAHPRIGIVLASDGGALEKMVPAFKMGIGGRIGDGQQFMSWVHLDDVVDALLFALSNPNIVGPFNCTAPEPVRNSTFAKALGRALRRPAALPLPRFAARLALGGEQAAEMLFASQRAIPAALVAAGWTSAYPTVDAALAEIFG